MAQPEPEAFRAFVVKRLGFWPCPSDHPVGGYSTWDVPLFEAMADFLAERIEKKAN
jgi:hypothetical protein